MFNNYDLLIIGSGPAGIAAAHAAIARGMQVLLIDSGLRFDDSSIIVSNKSEQENGDKPLVNPKYRLGADAPNKLYFGSDFATKMHPQVKLTSNSKMGGGPSFAVGGLGNIWGACLFPFMYNDIKHWPISYSELMNAYSEVLSWLPHSGGENWPSSIHVQGLNGSPSNVDPEISEKLCSLQQESSDGTLSISLSSLLAVESHKSLENPCIGCAKCLSGCPTNSIFNPRNQIPWLIAKGLKYIPGLLITKIFENEHEVRLLCIDETGSCIDITAKRVLLGAGPIVTTALMLDTLNLDSATLQDCQAFTLPILSQKSIGAPISPMSLAAAFVEQFRSSQSVHHFQIYGRGPELRNVVDRLLPLTKLGKPLIDKIMKHCLVGHGFLRPKESGTVSVIKSTESTDHSLRLNIYAHVNAETQSHVRDAVTSFSRFLRPARLYPLVPLTHTERVGASYHLGSSFPMNEFSLKGCSDYLGRPNGLLRIHLIDASSLPELPPQSPTLTVMANATRIVNDIHKNDL